MSINSKALTDVQLIKLKEILESSKMIERIASYAHAAWADWMNYLYQKVGNAFWEYLPGDLKNQWQRQCTTYYENLSEEDKINGRTEAHRIVRVIYDELLKYKEGNDDL